MKEAFLDFVHGTLVQLKIPLEYSAGLTRVAGNICGRKVDESCPITVNQYIAMVGIAVSHSPIMYVTKKDNQIFKGRFTDALSVAFAQRYAANPGYFQGIWPGPGEEMRDTRHTVQT